MTEQEFKKVIMKGNWFDFYSFKVLSILMIASGIFFIYLLISDLPKVKVANTQLAHFCFAVVFISGGILALSLIPNRYKILRVESFLPGNKKIAIISQIIIQFGGSILEQPEQVWSFRYGLSFWTQGYDVYLTFNEDEILVSVIGKLHVGSGFIDLGKTERLRKKLIDEIIEKLGV